MATVAMLSMILIATDPTLATGCVFPKMTVSRNVQ